MKYSIDMTNKLLEENGFTKKNLIDKQNQVIIGLNKRKKVVAKNPYTKIEQILPVIDFVYHVQSNMPWKLILLQKINNDGTINLRFCYYTLNFTLLKNEGKLQMMFGQFGLFIPPEDYKKLMDKAKQKGMI